MTFHSHLYWTRKTSAFFQASEFHSVFLIFMDPSCAKQTLRKNKLLHGSKNTDTKCVFTVAPNLCQVTVMFLKTLLGRMRSDEFWDVFSISRCVTVIVWFESLRVASCVRMICGGYEILLQETSLHHWSHICLDLLLPWTLKPASRTWRYSSVESLNQSKHSHPWP